MEVTVLYFAAARERAGLDDEPVTIAPGATVAALRDLLDARHPALAPLRPHTRVAVNMAFVQDDHPLSPGDEVALIPPVSGGAPRCWLSDTPLVTAQVVALVTRPQAGAVVTFEGVVRDHTGERQVAHLEYEVYPAMALAQLEAICDEIEARWPDTRVAIAHRHGRLEIGEASVVIAVSSPHRPGAFEACRHAIERIKESVPIWKKEVGPDGASWVGLGS